MTDINCATQSHSDTQAAPEEYNEQLLIGQAQGGCQEAMIYLFAYNEFKVKKFIQRKISNVNTVEHILQESLLQAYQDIREFHGRPKFSTWIIGIALNIVRNHCTGSPDYKS